MLPFSRINPPMIPAMANPMPPRVARSGRAPLFVLSGVFAIASVPRRLTHRAGMPVAVQHPPAEFQAPLDYFVRALENTQNLPVGQRNHGVRGNVNVLD